ncbi:hypothetical protein AYJ54_06360 [Bradyrhizobium centrolobii]|uniref:Uncharacterized protein n=1 Tax=Bradyrhizobium centrolobii TaxID=1505087 RepID=A0A176Z092_9BRAD|nr:hypothetical protein [Bradyrhizobium centrolobii]OAF12448.1 hypothetical protein AYJ54_06360 [Bradyrhizobium centrolobii]
MTKISIFGVTAVLAMIAATPVSAEFAQQEPAAFAAMYPNARNAIASVSVGPTAAFAYAPKRHAIHSRHSGLRHRY